MATKRSKRKPRAPKVIVRDTQSKFGDHLDELGLHFLRFAQIIGRDERTVRRWRTGEKPTPTEVMMLLESWIRHGDGPR
jgi:hypothetical protein